MGYYIDLKSISVDSYKEVLKTTELIPSWKILEEDVDKNLDIIKQHDIANLDELLIALKDKARLQAFAKKSGLSTKYLEVLKRVVNGYRQKPNRIRDFPCVSDAVFQKLDGLGLKNTLKLYDNILTLDKRKELSKRAGVSLADISKLTRLTDLSRIRWVNHTFAYILLESGYDTAEKVAKADYKALYTAIKKLNKERSIYNANIGERDMKMIIEFAQGLPLEIEY